MTADKPLVLTDTERLDWLSAHPMAAPIIIAGRVWSYDGHSEFRRPTLREAIDAAIAARRAALNATEL